MFLDVLSREKLVRMLTNDHMFVIDSSEFGDWSACTAKGMFKGGVRRGNAASQSALLFGGAVHKGLATYLKGGTVEEAMSSTRVEAVSTGLDTCLDPKRTIEKAVQMVESYIHHETIMGKKIIPLELNGIKMVEENFALPFAMVETKHFGTIQIMWSGIIDVIALEDNVLWVLDHKTTSMMGEKFIDDKERGNQLPGYTWVGRELTKALDKRLEGAIVNALCHRTGGFEFKRFKLPFNQWKIDEWKEQTIQRCTSIIDSVGDVLQGDLISVNRESCVTKYGKCSYFDVCNTVPTLRDKLLFDDAFFKENVWNPSQIEG